MEPTLAAVGTLHHRREQCESTGGHTFTVFGAPWGTQICRACALFTLDPLWSDDDEELPPAATPLHATAALSPCAHGHYYRRGPAGWACVRCLQAYRAPGIGA